MNTNLTPALAGCPSSPARASATALRRICWVASGSSSSASIWSRIAADEQSAQALRRARLLVSGSAALPTPVFHRIAELTGSAPIERYGMSETMITLSTRADGERRPGSVGQPVLGVDTRLRTEDGQVVPYDGESIGQLQVRGPMVFDEYLNKPEATAAAWTEDGWFMTGDVATRDTDGFHRIVGRESVDLIKSGGYRIGAGEVETALLAHPSVREVTVVGQADADLGQRVVAYVVTDEENQARLAERLIEFVAHTLSHHKRPREVVFLDELPETHTTNTDSMRQQNHRPICRPSFAIERVNAVDGDPAVPPGAEAKPYPVRFPVDRWPKPR